MPPPVFRGDEEQAVTGAGMTGLSLRTVATDLFGSNRVTVPAGSPR